MINILLNIALANLWRAIVKHRQRKRSYSKIDPKRISVYLSLAVSLFALNWLRVILTNAHLFQLNSELTSLNQGSLATIEDVSLIKSWALLFNQGALRLSITACTLLFWSYKFYRTIQAPLKEYTCAIHKKLPHLPPPTRSLHATQIC